MQNADDPKLVTLAIQRAALIASIQKAYYSFIPPEIFRFLSDFLFFIEPFASGT
jgi:hypothetical protein